MDVLNFLKKRKAFLHAYTHGHGLAGVDRKYVDYTFANPGLKFAVAMLVGYLLVAIIFAIFNRADVPAMTRETIFKTCVLGTLVGIGLGCIFIPSLIANLMERRVIAANQVANCVKDTGKSSEICSEKVVEANADAKKMKRGGA